MASVQFSQSCANYWMDVFHFDGLRMDAVSRLIYWGGDPNRGTNPSSINFLKRMNQGLHQLHPEECSSPRIPPTMRA